jgi:hypothetical protein
MHQFEKKFKDKSGLKWANRGDEPKPGKYAYVERSYNPDSEDEDDDEATGSGADGEKKDDVKPAECTLDKPTQDLMKLIFNQVSTGLWDWTQPKLLQGPRRSHQVGLFRCHDVCSKLRCQQAATGKA